MSKAPDLVHVTHIAREADPPVSSKVMLRRLKKLEASLEGRKILFKGEGKNSPWLADRTFLSRISNDGGMNIWRRLREFERSLALVTVEIGECKRLLAEHGIA